VPCSLSPSSANSNRSFRPELNGQEAGRIRQRRFFSRLEVLSFRTSPPRLRIPPKVSTRHTRTASFFASRTTGYTPTPGHDVHGRNFSFFLWAHNQQAHESPVVNVIFTGVRGRLPFFDLACRQSRRSPYPCLLSKAHPCPVVWMKTVPAPPDRYSSQQNPSAWLLASELGHTTGLLLTSPEILVVVYSFTVL